MVNRYGRVTQLLQDAKQSTFTEGVLTGTVAVPTSGELTFYTRHGELFAQICTGIAALFILVRLLRLRKLGGTNPGAVERSLEVSFKLSPRDPATPLRSARDDDE